MTRTFTALALALCATSALAQDYNRQDLVRGLCQKDGCDEFIILAADRIRGTDEGALFKTRLKTFHWRVRVELRDRDVQMKLLFTGSALKAIGEMHGVSIRAQTRPVIEAQVSLCVSDHLPLSEAAAATQTVLLDIVKVLMSSGHPGIRAA